MPPQPTRTLEDHLFGPGPKRILALDGGGIRGILTLQMLRRIETLVRARMQNPEAVLADYFDLIGGTSTGSIIASALAIGRSVDYVDKIYGELGNKIFEKELLRWGPMQAARAKFPTKPLKKSLKREFGKIKLGDADIRTGLAIVAKRLDTGSTWVVHNNPRGKYFEASSPDTVANKDYPLREVVRASTAAPTYFDPEEIQVAKGVGGAFIDGGVSPHNNPALQLLMLSTLQGHGIGWPMGADQILVVSLGTGGKAFRLEKDEVMDVSPLKVAVQGLTSLMDDTNELNQQILQWLSNSPTAHEIDSEVGDLAGDVLAREPSLSYLRYDVDFAPKWLDEKLGLQLDADALASIDAMDRPENMELLVRIGKAAGERLIRDEHFPKAFDPA